MAETNVLFINNTSINDSNKSIHAQENKEISVQNAQKKKEKYYAIVFLTAITGVSTLIGFGSALAAVKKRDPKYFNEGLGGGGGVGGGGAVGIKGLPESGASLAIRALGWGTLWAFTGCGILFYGIWKISGATNAKEFRMKMGSILPQIPKNDPPQSRTEFEGLTDLLRYISEDWGQKKE